MITLKHAFPTVMKTNIKILKSRLRDDTDDKSTISSIPNQNKNIGDICIKRSENKASVAMDRNGQHSHVNMKTQLKSESFKAQFGGQFYIPRKEVRATKMILRNISTRSSRGKNRPRADKTISAHVAY